jgi:hypothetical protein
MSNDAALGRIARVHDEEAHHAHGHLHHLVRVRVVHERAGLLQDELVNERLAGRDVRLGQAADPVHAVGQELAVPVHRCVLRQLVGDEDADLIALDCLNGRAGRLAVVAPQVRLHAGGELAHHGLGDEVELLPVAVLPPGQGPAVEGDDGLVVRSALRVERRLHRGLGHDRRLGQAGGLRAPADHGGSREGETSGAEEVPAR